MQNAEGTVGQPVESENIKVLKCNAAGCADRSHQLYIHLVLCGSIVLPLEEQWVKQKGFN